MNDEEFCKILGFTETQEKEVCLKIREITAAQCKIGPSLITPNDDTDRLNHKTFDGWDDVPVLIGLESAFGVSLEDVLLPNFIIQRFFFFMKKEKPLNYGEWMRKAVEVVAPVISQANSRP